MVWLMSFIVAHTVQIAAITTVLTAIAAGETVIEKAIDIERKLGE